MILERIPKLLIGSRTGISGERCWWDRILFLVIDSSCFGLHNLWKKMLF